MTKYKYDGIGNIIEIEYLKNKTDINGNIYDTSLGSDKVSIAYNYKTNTITATNENGKITVYDYDSVGNKLSVISKSDGTAGAKDIVLESYTYDTRLRPTEAITGKAKTTYTYDNRDRVITTKVTDKDTGELLSDETYSYINNSTGLQTTHTLNGDSTAANIVTVTQQDVLGRTYSEKVGSATTTYTYDYLNNVIKEVGANTNTYEYDFDGNICRATDSTGNGTLYYYDSSNRLTEETCYSENSLSYTYVYNYNSLGNRTSLEYNQNGVDTYRIYYNYDKNNRLLKENKTVYNNQGNAIGHYNITEYSYDSNGNQISKVKYNQNIENKFTVSINNTNTDDSTSYEIFTYDRLNELTSYKNSKGTTAIYKYLPNHYRMSKTVDRVLTQQIWDGDNIVAEANSSNTILRSYTRGHQLLTDDDRRAYMYDGHGNLVQQNRGTTAENVTMYDAYGNKIEKTGTTNDTPFGYCGEYLDKESGLIYLRNRYYDSESGRFISEDPIKDGVNWYSYCGGNPVMFWDLLGLEDVYIFYNEADENNASLEDRAYKRKKELELEGKTVYIKMISNAKQFKEEWDNMDNKGSEIELVELFFHANPQAIIMNGEPLVIESRNYQGDCVHVKDLKEKNINTIILNSCNSAHQDYSTENLAFEFAKYQNVENVYGWDGSMRWSVLTGKPILNSGTDYFASWLRNGKRSELGFIKYTKSMGTITVYSNINGQTLNVNDLKNINNYRLLNAYDLNENSIYYEKTEGVA